MNIRSRCVELWNQGLSSREIGNQLGITRNAVIGQINRARISGEHVERSVPSRVPKEPKPRRKRVPKLAKPEPAKSVPKLKLVKYEPPRVVVNTFRIYDLGPRMCKYPTKVSKEGQQLFCGDRTDNIYCEKHHKLCYTKSDVRPSAGTGFKFGRFKAPI